MKASDRTYQIWERNALHVSLWSRAVIKQKLDYIHNNPVAAGMCINAEDYMYSSAVYEKGIRRWTFLTHYDA